MAKNIEVVYTPSYWETQFYNHADIVILGAGFVGLQTAINLKQAEPKKQVWILDSYAPGAGASLRNAGFACFGNMGEILDDAQEIGLKNACNLYVQRHQGFEQLSKTVSHIKMGYTATGGLEVFTSTQGAEQEMLLGQIEQVNHLIFEQLGIRAFEPKNIDKKGLAVLPTAIYTKHEGSVQTHLLYHNLYALALQLGVKILSGIEITNIEIESTDKQSILAKNGLNIKAKKTIVCTNAWAARLLKTKVIPARGQIIVSNNLPNLAWTELIHNHKGFYYARRLGNRILLGGARHLCVLDETTFEQGINTKINQNLREFMQQVLAPGQTLEIEYEWSGAMAMGDSKQPIIKEIQPGLYCAVKMGGMGLALSATAANVVCELVMRSRDGQQ